MLRVFYYIILLCLLCVDCEYLQQLKGAECSWEGVKGRCVILYKCLSAVKDIEYKKHPPICEFEGTTPIVCCTDCDLVNDTRLMLFDPTVGILEKTGTSKAKDKCLDYIYSISYPCKKNKHYKLKKVLNIKKNCHEMQLFNTLIPTTTGGRDALREEFPHMALLGYGDDMETADWLCGGSVISERFIITAGHCASTPDLRPVKYIALGILKRTDPLSMWQTYNVKRIITHPEYKPPSKYNDIALLETDKEINFNSQVRPACLNVDEEDADEVGDATGWGALGHKIALSDVLQTVQLQRFREEECSRYYPKHRNLENGYNHSTQMCYGNRKEPKDTCEGDSGGPLQSRYHERCVFTILGVTSYGRQCGIANSPGMYTRVYHYVPWIESIVWH